MPLPPTVRTAPAALSNVLSLVTTPRTLKLPPASLLMAARQEPLLFARLVLFEPIARPPDDVPIDASEWPIVIGARRRKRQFPSFQAAHDCWHSPEYQAAIALRLPASTIDLVIVEGYDGPQPA